MKEFVSESKVVGFEEVRSADAGELIAFVVRRNFSGQKYNFPTPPEFPLQLGVNFYKAGEEIQAHRHLPRPRTFQETQEFITISEGSVVLHLYGNGDALVKDVAMNEGDSVLLISGGHSFTVKSDAKITEIKLGPYDETNDKIRFSPHH